MRSNFSRREFMLFGGVASSLIALYFFREASNNIGLRYLLRKVNILDGYEPLNTTPYELIKENEQRILELGAIYNISPKSLMYLICEELGYTNIHGALGIGKYSEQVLKANINQLRTQLGDLRGDKTPEGKSIGLSYGLINIKPGLVTRAVIESIKNEELRQLLSQHYQDNLNMVEPGAFAGIAANFDLSLEIASANMSIWRPYVERFVAKNTTVIFPVTIEDITFYNTDHLLCAANGSYPYEQNRLYKLLGSDVPNLLDDGISSQILIN